ncbi:UreD urease accessory protein [Xylogone sp. PMI_703]|nr:UreD urease accessory protein [Xylogone sp. PMI_703]
MTSPFPPSSSSPGEGHLRVHLLPHGISALSLMAFQYPLKLISPSPSVFQKSVLVFLLTYGGGLVGGDQVHLTIDVKGKSKLSIVTQGHTKIFKSPSSDVVTTQQLKVHIDPGAAVCLLPDPVQPFAESVYSQSQIFVLCNDASLCLLDWVSAGRTARGEYWDFWEWTGRNEVWAETNPESPPRLLLRDNVLLRGSSTSIKGGDLKNKMQGLFIFGTLILRGPLMSSLAQFFLAEFSKLPRIGARDFRSHEKIKAEDDKELPRQDLWRATRLKQEKEDHLLWSVAQVRGCIVVKFGAKTVEGARIWLREMIKEEGTIAREFGEDSTMCIR